MNKSNSRLLQQMGRALREEGITPKISVLGQKDFEPLKFISNTENSEGLKKILDQTGEGSVFGIMHQPVEHENCLECGRKLKGRKARIRGMGKTCEKKRAVRLQGDLFEHKNWEELGIEIMRWVMQPTDAKIGIINLIDNLKSKYKITKR